VENNGHGYMQVILLRGNDFSRKYFPNPFIRLWKVIKPVRPIFVVAAHFLIAFGKTGFYFCAWLQNKTFGHFFFRCASKNTHRLGFLKAMKKGNF
jgi:hypothetical protein